MSILALICIKRFKLHLGRLQIELIFVRSCTALRSQLFRLSLVQEFLLVLIQCGLRGRLGHLLLVGSINKSGLSTALAFLLVGVERILDEV